MEENSQAEVQVKRTVPPSVVVSGDINYRSVSGLKEALAKLIEEGCRQICLDCKTVDFVDSSGIGVIASAAGRLKSSGGQLQLRHRTRQLEHALVVSGFASLIQTDETQPSAPPPAVAADHVWQTMDLSLPARADVDAVIRRRVMEIAQTMPFSREDLDDIKLAVGEAASNAFRHGRFDDEADKVRVSCISNSRGLTAEITNPGIPFDPAAITAPDVSRLPEGGMGIHFMRASMDRVEFEFGPRSITVRLTKEFGGASER